PNARVERIHTTCGGSGVLALLCGRRTACAREVGGGLARRTRSCLPLVRAASRAHPRGCRRPPTRPRTACADRVRLLEPRTIFDRTYPRPAGCHQRPGWRATPRRGLFNPFDHSFGEGAGVEISVSSKHRRRLSAVRSRDGHCCRNRGRASSSAEALGRGLRRPATFLRKVGIEIAFERGARTRKILITRRPQADWVGEKPSQPSQPGKINGLGVDGSGYGFDDGSREPSWSGLGRDSKGQPSPELSPEPSPANPLFSLANDSSDGSDSKIPTHSNAAAINNGIPGCPRRSLRLTDSEPGLSPRDLQALGSWARISWC